MPKNSLIWINGLPTQEISKNQGNHDRGIRLNDEFRRVFSQLAPGDFLVGDRSRIGAVRGRGIAYLAEISP